MKSFLLSTITLIVFNSLIQDIGTVNVAKNKPTGTGSAIYGEFWKTYLAVDGGYTTAANVRNTCAITKQSGGKMPSWWINLEKEYLISSVKIFTRSDCECGNQFQGVTVKVGSSINDLTTCGHFKGPAKKGEVVEIQCNKRGSFVFMEVADQLYLSMCEVEVHADTGDAVNVAQNKPTGTGSEIYGEYWKTPLAVDGGYTTAANVRNTCAITKQSGGKMPSWWVNLQKEYLVSHLEVYTRSDCACGNQFQGVTVKVGSSINDLTACGYYAGPPKQGEVVEIQCNKKGSFVFMEVSNQLYLSMCEVEVVATEIKDCHEDGEYNGKKDTTRGGIKCQRWDSDSPHTRSGAIRGMDSEELTKMGNYCRQPSADPETEPWCYTTSSDKRWDYCGVPKC